MPGSRPGRRPMAPPKPRPPENQKPQPDEERLAQRRPRRCLRCGRMFDSHGPGNRICKPCQHGRDVRERADSPFEPFYG